MNKKYDVLVSGYTSMDHIIKIKSPVETGFTSLVSNKTCNDIYYGGCSVNIAYALSKLGLSSMPMIRVGDDYEEIGFKAFLEGGGVQVDAIKKVLGEKTSQCFLIQDNNGQHITLFYPGAMEGIHFAPMDDSYFRDVQLGVITVGARCDNEEFFKKCKKHHIPLVFGMKGDMDAFPEDFLKELLLYCDIVFTNECERESIESLFKMNLLDLFEIGNVKIIVTTLGKNGSCFYSKTDEGIVEGKVSILPDLNVVDTTGSGDGYISGFLYGYLSGESVEDCAKLGTVLSSYIIEKEGCCTNAPDVKTLMERFHKFNNMIGGK